MRVLSVLPVLCLALVVGVGCAEEGESGSGASLGGEAPEGLGEEFGPEPDPEFEEEPEGFEEPEEEAVECHPSYEGACLDPAASDYDCEGGSGDGPLYTGPVTVVGSDEYGLDSDGDGSACEAS